MSPIEWAIVVVGWIVVLVVVVLIVRRDGQSGRITLYWRKDDHEKTPDQGNGRGSGEGDDANGA